MKYFLGINVHQDSALGVIWVGQPVYGKELLEKFGMIECNELDSPCDPGLRLVRSSSEEEAEDPVGYRSLIGGLLYLSLRTRPDMAFAVANVAKFSAHPNKSHWIAAKRVLRYLKGRLNYGIRYSKMGDATLVGYSDSDWEGDVEDRRSTSGYVFNLADGPVSWRSQKQQAVALSTAEAEYMALSSTCQEAVWLRNLLTSMGLTLRKPTVIFEDNLASIGLAKNPQYHGRAKHIDIRYHFRKEM